MPTAAEQLVAKVRDTIEKRDMLGPGDAVLAAVSGGPDSICLLYVLRELDCNVRVAHLDHQTRQGQSAADARFVVKVAESLGVPCHVHRYAVAEGAAQYGDSFEEYARKIRYEYLRNMAEQCGCRAIATGHHADDQAETVLMRVLRGGWPEGLAGIGPVSRPRSGAPIIRPLLNCMREEILAYLNERGVAFRTDETNADTRHPRNRIRHDLLPLLEERYNPQIREALIRLGELQRAENEVLDGLTEAALSKCVRRDRIDRAAFASLSVGIQRRVLAKTLSLHGIDTEYDRVERARALVLGGDTGKRVDIGNGFVLINEREESVLSEDVPAPDSAEIELNVPGDTLAHGMRFRVTWLDARPPGSLASYCTGRRQVFDGEAIHPPLVVRTRRPGDRFRPIGMRGTKKLQDYFVDEHVAQFRRDTVPLVVSGDRIVWVVGHAPSADAAVTARTRRILQIEAEDAWG
ncbi:MAG: tRNA(Ile)-lysidine synthase [Candidatus Hydrogenedentota bacterium]